MISPPKHNLFKYIIDNLESEKDKHVLGATGPWFLTEKINNYTNDLESKSSKVDIDILPMPLIYTREYNRKCEECKTLFPDSYTTTFWTATWLKNKLK